jgi:hypothetical protein
MPGFSAEAGYTTLLERKTMTPDFIQIMSSLGQAARSCTV